MVLCPTSYIIIVHIGTRGSRCCRQTSQRLPSLILVLRRQLPRRRAAQHVWGHIRALGRDKMKRVEWWPLEEEAGKEETVFNCVMQHYYNSCHLSPLLKAHTVAAADPPAPLQNRLRPILIHQARGALARIGLGRHQPAQSAGSPHHTTPNHATPLPRGTERGTSRHGAILGYICPWAGQGVNMPSIHAGPGS